MLIIIIVIIINIMIVIIIIVIIIIILLLLLFHFPLHTILQYCFRKHVDTGMLDGQQGTAAAWVRATFAEAAGGLEAAACRDPAGGCHASVMLI